MIAALMSMGAMTTDIALPAVPEMARDLGSSVPLAQLIVAFFFLGFGVGQLFLGALSDAFGRRPVLLGGVALFASISLLCTLVDDISLLLALRFLQGIAGASGPVLSRAMIRDRFEGREMARLMSFVMAVFILAPILAPSIGALLLGLGSWRWIFAFLALYGVGLLLSSLVLLEETLARPERGAWALRHVLRGYSALFGDARSRRFGTVTVFTFVVLVVYLTNVPAVLMEELGAGVRRFALLFGLVAACSGIGSLLNARLVRSFPLVDIIRAGLACMVAGAALDLALLGSAPAGPEWLVPGFGLCFFGFSLVVSNSTTLTLAPHARMVGTVVSALGVLQTFVPAVVAALAAVLLGSGGRVTLALMGGIPAILLWRLSRAKTVGWVS